MVSDRLSEAQATPMYDPAARDLNVSGSDRVFRAGHAFVLPCIVVPHKPDELVAAWR